MPALVLLTTAGSEEQANRIARELVARRQAACVNVLPGVRSIYRWQGEVCEDAEFLLLAKTEAGAFEAAAATIRELHSYELPEILAVEVARGDAGYLAWLAASVDQAAAGEGGEADEAGEGRAPLARE